MLFVAMAAYYGHDIADAALQLYVEDLSDLEIGAIKYTLTQMRRDPKVRRMPLPAEIREMIRPAQISDDDQAREAAARILTAISRFGWNNHERARAYVGELGWAVVQAQGGWMQLCEEVTDSRVGTYQAQWRDLAASIQRRSRAGQYGEAPSLPAPQSERMRGLIQAATRRLDGPEGEKIR